MYPHIAFSVCLVPCLPKKFLRMWEKDPVLQESDESLENREGYSIKYSFVCRIILARGMDRRIRNSGKIRFERGRTGIVKRNGKGAGPRLVPDSGSDLKEIKMSRQDETG